MANLASTAFLTAVLAGAAAPLAAAEPPRPAALDALTACRAIADDTARLACFDREAAALGASIERKDVVVLDRQDVKKTKRSLFGFNLPKLPFFGGEDGKDAAEEEDEFVEIETTIKELRKLRSGHWSFTIDEGAQWQTTELGPILPQAGQKVTIKKGALGSYFIRFERSRPVRGMRVG